MRIYRLSRWQKTVLALMLILKSSSASPPPINNGGMILRVRLSDGSMERIHVASGSEDTTTLSQILKPLSSDSSSTIQVGSTTVTDDSRTLSSLGLKHGSLITLTPPKSDVKPTSRFSRYRDDENCFDPFPDLNRRDYATAVQRKARRRGGMSYGDLANVQSALHVVEPQLEGPLKRVYMCRSSAERFQSNCVNKKKHIVESRVGLLLGTLQRERVDLKPVARTSLSSRPSDQDYCQVVKVHAVWEPAQSASQDRYDASSLLDKENASLNRVLKVASWLGLTPVGWIFSYTDKKRVEDDSLPVWGADVHHGATLQIANMQRDDNKDGAKFVTLAMDANEGATEAFQLSDVSVQMVAENMFDASEPGRFVTTKHEVIVDGKETTQLDSVLCLVNTAMLSHDGSFAGTHSVKKSGSLTTKTKKALLTALNKESSDSLLNELCDFNILMALDDLLPAQDTEELCRLVRKWARGQKRGTEVSKRLKLVLESVLNS